MRPFAAAVVLSLLVAVAASAADAPTTPAGGAVVDPGEALRQAARAGDRARVAELLAAGTPVDAANRYGATALGYAADHGHLEVVRLLLDQGADPNHRDTFYKATPLAWAYDHPEIARALLDGGAEAGTEALMGAVYQGGEEVVGLILERKQVDAAGLSQALAAAEQVEAPEIAERLRAAGAVPPPAADAVVPADVLARYAGTYVGDDGAERKVTVADGKLAYANPAGEVTVLGAVDERTFRFPQAPVTIGFPAGDGPAASFTVTYPDGSSHEMRRKEEP